MKIKYIFTAKEVALAIGLLILGLLFWEFKVLYVSNTAVGTFIFIILATIIAFIYMLKNGIRQNKKSILVLAILIIGSLPFILYDPTEIYFFLFSFEAAAFLLWIMYSCNNQVSDKLSGFLFVDSINQFVTTPLCNYDGLFRCVFTKKEGRKSTKSLIFAIIGIIAAIPLLTIVIRLLASADDGFARIAEKIFEIVSLQQIFSYTFELMIGIPIAAYLFGSIYGNSHRRFSQILTNESSSSLFERLHMVPRAALYAPLILFNVIYILFFIGLATYLFSGFAGDLPAEYTYSTYARKGFFELCGVAGINLFLLAIVYFFGKRKNKEYPTYMRLLTCLFSALTVLLIVTAISKMMLYIKSFGLTPMRVYVLFFLLFIFIVFLMLIIWHIKPINVGKPIIIAGIVLILTLFMSNHEGLIAKYNIDNYMNGNLNEFDTELLVDMSDAVLPPLIELRDSLPQSNPLKKQVQDTIDEHVFGYLDYDYYNDNWGPSFSSWNIQTHIANKKLEQ